MMSIPTSPTTPNMTSFRLDSTIREKEQIKGLFQVFYQDAFSPARAESRT